MRTPTDSFYDLLMNVSVFCLLCFVLYGQACNFARLHGNYKMLQHPSSMSVKNQYMPLYCHHITETM